MGGLALSHRPAPAPALGCGSFSALLRPYTQFAGFAQVALDRQVSEWLRAADAPAAPLGPLGTLKPAAPPRGVLGLLAPEDLETTPFPEAPGKPGAAETV